MFLFLFLFFFPLYADAQGREIVINEVMQSNIDGIMIENDFPDSWVELYNTSDNDIYLTNWSIGEKNDRGKSYKLPKKTILPAHGYLVLLCDKIGKELHTDFRIDAGNASLFLFDEHGDIVDSLLLTEMPAPQVAYGRECDGGDMWHYELTATPGSANQGGGSEVLLPQPVFNVTGGVYSSSFTLTISVPDDESLPEGTRLYITTDGSEPTESSRWVNDSHSFYVSQTMVVRAKLIAPGCLYSRSTTHSYIIHPRNTDLPIVSIVSDNAYFYDNNIGILSSAVNDGVPNYMQKWRRPVNLEYFDTHSGRCVFNQLGETAVSGVSTREQAQKSLKIYTNKRFGKKNFKGDFWRDKPEVNKVKSFVLRSGGNNSFLSRINDALVQTVFGTHVSNLDWQAYQPVIVYLNGKYMGEYGMRERSDETYVESNYGISEIEMADETSYQTPSEGSLFAQFRAKYMRDDVTYEELSSLMDIDNFVNTLIAEMYAQNTDYPTNNVAMWRSLADAGKWRWILKDMDRFGMSLPLYPSTFDMVNYMFNPNDLQFGGMHHFDLYSKMVSFSEFRELFLDRISVYLGDFLKPSTVIALLESMDEDIMDELRATFASYNVSFNSFSSSNRSLIDVIQNRPKILSGQVANFFHLGKSFAVKVECGDCDVAINGIRLTEGGFDGYYFSSRALRINSGTSDYGWLLRVDHKNGTTTEHTIVRSDAIIMLSDYMYDEDDHINAVFSVIPMSDIDGETSIYTPLYDTCPATYCYSLGGIPMMVTHGVGIVGGKKVKK